MWIRPCYNKVHVFLVLKTEITHKFSYFVCFEEHLKKYAAFATYAACLYSSYRSNCKLSLILIL